MNADQHEAIMELCRIRDRLAELAKGEYPRSRHTSQYNIGTDYGMRKAKMKDVKELCSRLAPRLNAAINTLAP